jgi:hypothetical protein
VQVSRAGGAGECRQAGGGVQAARGLVPAGSAPCLPLATQPPSHPASHPATQLPGLASSWSVMGRTAIAPSATISWRAGQRAVAQRFSRCPCTRTYTPGASRRRCSSCGGTPAGGGHVGGQASRRGWAGQVSGAGKQAVEPRVARPPVAADMASNTPFLKPHAPSHGLSHTPTHSLAHLPSDPV